MNNDGNLFKLLSSKYSLVEEQEEELNFHLTLHNFVKFTWII
jgi:hypothetical protein